MVRISVEFLEVLWEDASSGSLGKHEGRSCSTREGLVAGATNQRLFLRLTNTLPSCLRRKLHSHLVSRRLMTWLLIRIERALFCPDQVFDSKSSLSNIAGERYGWLDRCHPPYRSVKIGGWHQWIKNWWVAPMKRVGCWGI